MTYRCAGANALAARRAKSPGPLQRSPWFPSFVFGTKTENLKKTENRRISGSVRYPRGRTSGVRTAISRQLLIYLSEVRCECVLRGRVAGSRDVRGTGRTGNE